LRRFVCCLAGLHLLVSVAYAADPFSLLTLTVPPATSAHESIRVDATIGALPRGSLLNFETEDGQLIGSVSPFGPTALTPQTYTIPLPNNAVKGTAVRLRAQVQPPSGPARAPTPRELLGVKLIRAPTDN
jgi:hypothetical protein